MSEIKSALKVLTSSGTKKNITILRNLVSAPIRI